MRHRSEYILSICLKVAHSLGIVVMKIVQLIKSSTFFEGLCPLASFFALARLRHAISSFTGTATILTLVHEGLFTQTSMSRLFLFFNNFKISIFLPVNGFIKIVPVLYLYMQWAFPSMCLWISYKIKYPLSLNTRSPLQSSSSGAATKSFIE